MTAPLFEIQDLRVASAVGSPGAQPTPSQEPVEILKGVSLTIARGEIHAIVGPNGSGKSTLASTLLGSPNYVVTSGRILFKGDDITTWSPDVRAKAGLFLAFQCPQQIAGVSVLNFVRQALAARKPSEMSIMELRRHLMDWMTKLDLSPNFLERHANEGFSDYEMKRNELLQMAVLEPEMAIVDETDSDLDIDALKSMASGLQAIKQNQPELGLLMVSHHQRPFDHLEPDAVHVLADGRIVKSAGPELAFQAESKGFEGLHS